MPDETPENIDENATPEDDLNRTRIAESPGEVLVGTEIGNYRIRRILGRGGFGSVYEAEDTKLGRTVALKFLNYQFDKFHAELFEREAKALATLSKHPNIVQIHSFDSYQGRNFFVLEYVDYSAARLLDEHPDGLSVERACAIVQDCADAVAFAHDSNILHRDIKSANILIERDDGRAKVADFGLARIGEVSSNTIEGAAIGSPIFMAPEQIRGEELTKQCDVYSLGVTLYELLSGKTPVTGTSPLEVMEKVRIGDLTPLREHRPELPEALLAIVEKATALNPKDRFPSAGALARAIQQFLDGEAPTLVPMAAKTKKKGGMLRWVVAAIILFAVGYGAMAYMFSDASDAPPESEAGIATDDPVVVPEPIFTDDPEPIPEPEPEIATIEPEPSTAPVYEPVSSEPEPVPEAAHETAEPEPVFTEENVIRAVEEVDKILEDILDTGGGPPGQGKGNSGGKGKGRGKKK